MDEFLGMFSWIAGVSLILALLLLAGVYGCAQRQIQGQLTSPPTRISAAA